MDFRTFLERARKSNGEKYLSKTIEIYIRIIERHQHLFENKSVDELIEEMNKHIIRYNHPNMRASFRAYLLYLGLEEDSSKLKLLKSSKKRASAINSLRMLSEKVINKNDLQLLFSKLEPEWELMIRFLYDTGCRESEMLGVRRKDVNIFDEPKNNIFAEVTVLGKGHKKRNVYLMERTVKLFKELKFNLKPEQKCFVFVKSNGKPYKRQDSELLKGFRKRTKEILGRSYVIHSLRHTKLTHLADKGADLLGISSYAGHSNIAVTQVYVKASSHLGKMTFEKYSEDV